MEGNQMKMRETLLVVSDALDTISAHEDDIEFVRAWISQTKNAVQEALSAPPRQCDVGTAEEQVDRYCRHCQKHCISCERRYACNVCGERYRLRCIARWAQTPYEAKEGGAS